LIALGALPVFLRHEGLRSGFLLSNLLILTQ